MKKLFSLLGFVLACFTSLFAVWPVYTQVNTNYEAKTSTSIETSYSSAGYIIKEFESLLSVEKDTSLLAIETIKVDFQIPKHGIIRVIPVTYSSAGRTIRAAFNLESIEDEKGNRYLYEVSRFNQSIKLKIGDPDKTLTGSQTYVIKYRMGRVLLRYDSHDEVYWNVTGSEWDTVIEKAQATVQSPYAKIIRVKCYASLVGTALEDGCKKQFEANKAIFSTTAPYLGPGKDFTTVVALDKNNELQFPGRVEQTQNFIFDNWGYIPSVLPFLLIFIYWYIRGRDKRYLTENVFYKPTQKHTRTVSFFERKHLPFVYHPIQGLTPSQVGTIIDERVDLADIVAEIVELARLGYLTIEKYEKKKLFGKDNEYIFRKKDKDTKDTKELKNYQKTILEALFISKVVTESKKSMRKLGLSASEDTILLSALENHFYKHLDNLRKELYQSLVSEKIFAENPDKVRTKWLAIFIVFWSFVLVISLAFFAATFNFGPFLVLLLTLIPGVILAISMPRRSAWGYSLYRQAVGLREYLEKGKWRTEIAEKHLFIEEMLPLAVSLGVVDKLTEDMAKLRITPPRYFTGVSANTFSSDFSNFQSNTTGKFVSTPSGTSWSGRSFWSGGSGFSGGGAGGGFGGGGGGSW